MVHPRETLSELERYINTKSVEFRITDPKKFNRLMILFNKFGLGNKWGYVKHPCEINKRTGKIIHIVRLNKANIMARIARLKEKKIKQTLLKHQKRLLPKQSLDPIYLKYLQMTPEELRAERKVIREEYEKQFDSDGCVINTSQERELFERESKILYLLRYMWRLEK